MNQDNSNLLENLQTNPDIRPPYFWHHIRPDRQQWGIVEIWRRSGPVTRPFFDRGITTGEYGPNWVTGWLLYSVFRSRDIRNNRNRRKNDNGSGNNNNSGNKPSYPRCNYCPSELISASRGQVKAHQANQLGQKVAPRVTIFSPGLQVSMTLCETVPVKCPRHVCPCCEPSRVVAWCWGGILYPLKSLQRIWPSRSWPL